MQNKLGIGVTTLGVVVVVVVAVVGWAVVPKIINDKIKEEFRLTEGSEVMETWEDVPFPIYLNFYVFNILNPDEVEAGEKPKLQERGPYVYRQRRQKVNLNHFDLSNPENTIQYNEKKTYTFDEEQSGTNRETDLVNIINVPFIAVIHSVRAKAPSLASVIASAILPNETLVRRDVQVGDLLFYGFDVQNYKDSMLGPMLPKEFDGGRFGLYKGENGTESEQYNIYTGVDDSEQFGLIKHYKGDSYLHFWQNGSFCDTVRGSDGSLFPPFVKKDRKFYVFSSDLCRSLLFEYDSETEFRDVKLYRFKVPKRELEDPRKNPENQCYCLAATLEECSKAGTMSLEGCKDGAPIMMSGPYFLDGDSSYVEDVGLPNPDPEKHLTYLDIEPNSGVLFRAHKRIQVNIDLKVGYDIPQYKGIKKDIVFPLVWADENAEIDDPNANRIKDQLLKPKKTVDIVRWALIGVGIATVIVGAIIFVVRRRRSTETV